MPAVIDGLLNRVLLEGASGLLAGRNPRQRNELPTRPRRQTELQELARITGGAVQLHGRETARCCAFSRPPRPPRASPRRLESWLSSKAVCSAVACSSMNFPEPVITTFMST